MKAVQAQSFFHLEHTFCYQAVQQQLQSGMPVFPLNLKINS